MKLIPIDQLPAEIKEKSTRVLLYVRDEWLRGWFTVGYWCGNEWLDTNEDRTVYDVAYFALLPDEPEVTAEERAAFEAREKLRLEELSEVQLRRKAKEDAFNADPNNFPASLDDKEKWEWIKKPADADA